MGKVKLSYNPLRHNFDQAMTAVKQLFGTKLVATLIHGSLFDGTFGDYSDYDIVVIANGLPDDVLVRDQYAQVLKKGLQDKWTKNPFSFDFYTKKEFVDSVKNGHPFTKSILTKGCSIFDPQNIFEQCNKIIPKRIQKDIAHKKSTNLLFLADKYIKQAKSISKNGQHQFAIMLASDAIVLFARSKLIAIGQNIYQGEIYQFFVKEFSTTLSDEIKNNFWEFVFPAAQISFRFKQPHVDVPLQDTPSIYNRIDKKLVDKLIKFYSELKKCF